MRKKIITLSLILFAAFVGRVFAQTGSFEISVTPIVTYSITISTPSTGLNFGNVELNTTYIHQTSVTIKNTGNVRADWTLKAVPLDTWMLGENNLNDNGLDKAVLAAVFNSTPTNITHYENNDVLSNSEKDANESYFSGDQNGNDVLKNSERLLWLYMKTPTDSSVNTQQRFRIEVRAYPANKF